MKSHKYISSSHEEDERRLHYGVFDVCLLGLRGVQTTEVIVIYVPLMAYLKQQMFAQVMRSCKAKKCNYVVMLVSLFTMELHAAHTVTELE